MTKNPYGHVPGTVDNNRPAGGGYDKVTNGYGNVPSGNRYGNVPGGGAAANAVLSAAGIQVPSLDLPVDQFVQAVDANGYDNLSSPLGAPLDSGGASPSANGGGYDVVQFSPEQRFENACEEAERANASRKHKIWQELHAAFQRDIGSRLLPTGRLKHLSSTNYVMEGIDSKHRMGDMLASCLQIYQQRKPTKPFFSWLDSQGEFEQIVTLREGREAESGVDIPIPPSTVRAFVRGVAYLDASTNGSYRITIANGKLYQNGKLLDTSSMSTVHSGKGFAIFVQSPKGVFYSASHVLGEFHHSSFLGGAAVKSAGEWVVKQGEITWLSAKSGHYKPEMYHFVQGIEHLKNKNAIKANTLARVYDSKGAMNLHAMDLLNPVVANQWKSWG